MENAADYQNKEVDDTLFEDDKAIQIDNPAFPETVAEKNSQLEKALYSQKFFIKNRFVLNEHTLSITPNYIMIDDQAATNILLQSVVGATVNKVPTNESKKLKMNDLFNLTIHVFAKSTVKSFFGSVSNRRNQYELQYYITDEKIANIWKNLIIQAANNPKFMMNAHQYPSPEQVPPFKRRLLVFVNPASGKKLAVKRWQRAKPFLERAGCTFVEVFTEYSGHARDYVLGIEQSELLEYDGLVTVSGDGLPHEVITALFRREDIDKVKHIPIGPLPGGSANAIVKNLLSRAGEETSVRHACYLIVKGKTTQADLVELEMPNKPNVYCFLSFVWAVMARIDIESEKIRWLGPFRFDVYGAFSILKLKKQKAKFSYSSTINTLPNIEEKINEDDNWKIIDDMFSYFNLHNMPYITDSYVAAPCKDIQDGYNHFIALKGASNTRMKMTKVLLGLGSGFLADEAKMKNAGVFYEKLKAFRLEIEDGQNNYYSIDGEKYESNKVQGHMLEKALTLFCTK